MSKYITTLKTQFSKQCLKEKQLNACKYLSMFPVLIVGFLVWLWQCISGHFLSRNQHKRVLICIGILCVLIYIPVSIFTIRKSSLTQFKTLANMTSNELKRATGLDKEQTITVEFMGRLGNLMFQFSFLYVQAKVHGLRMVLRSGPGLDKLKEAFDIDFSPWEVDWPENVFKEHFVEINDKWDCAYDQDVALKPKGHAKYKGFFQSWKYFFSYEEDIRRLFTFKKYFVEAAQDLLAKLSNVWRLQARKEDPLFIGIHIRRGDILSTSNFVDYGYRVADAAYIDHAIEHFTYLYPNALFVACSNDYNWTRDYVKQHGNAVLVAGDSEISDMVLLTVAKHTIMTTGTFGWWVAFLVDGKTTYYKHPFTPGSGFAEQFKGDTHFHLYPKWTGLE